MSLIYGTSKIHFALKIFPFQYSQLLRSPSHKSHHSHSAGNVRENVYGYGLGLTVFVLSQITMCAFEVIGSSTKFCRSTATVLLAANPIFYEIIQPF